jgi:Cft2 family RNA processing exonuclease
VIVDSSVAFISRVYNENGMRLNFINQQEEEAQELLKEKSCILIISSFQANSFLFERDVFEFAFTSGWALKFKPKNFSAAFPLSSHADYYQLLKFVEACAPRKVYTFHGYAEDLAKAIKAKLNIDAQPVYEIPQRKLSEF